MSPPHSSSSSYAVVAPIGVAPVVPVESAHELAEAPRDMSMVRRVLLAVVALTAVHVAGPLLGVSWGIGISLALLAGVVALGLAPGRAYPIAGLTGFAVLVQWVPLRYVAFHLFLVGVTYLLRRRTWLLALFVVATVIVVPKVMFRQYYHWPFLHDWLNPFLLAHLFLVVAYWWRTDRRGRATEQSFVAWVALLLFPTNPVNPMNFGPGDIWRARTADERSVLYTLLLVSIKAFALVALGWLFPRGRLSDRDAQTLLTLPWGALWGAVFHSYLFCALTLSGAADVVILIARVMGWNLAHHFRFALLAWNPVELWRRWAIYNRKLLLTTVYFPLGGGDRHRTFNVLCTFLASGLFLHTGWVGSKYWEVGVGGWRDQTVYFLLQGIAVCVCLWWWRFTGKDPAADRDLRWSWGRALCTVGTQALSAWLHILVLAGQVPWGTRWLLMLRCLGLGALFGPP